MFNPLHWKSGSMADLVLHMTFPQMLSNNRTTSQEGSILLYASHPSPEKVALYTVRSLMRDQED